MRNYTFNLSIKGLLGCVYYNSTGKGFSGEMYIVENYTDKILWKEDFSGNFRHTGEMLVNCQTKIIKVAHEDL